jgi:hypothetical protein
LLRGWEVLLRNLDDLLRWLSRAGPRSELGRRLPTLRTLLYELAELREVAQALQPARNGWEWGRGLAFVAAHRTAELERLQGLTERPSGGNMRSKRTMTLDQLRVSIANWRQAGAAPPVFWDNMLLVIEEIEAERLYSRNGGDE